jgi:hypothetical protein
MTNVFASILGQDYLRLPKAVRHFHEVQQATFVGEAVVRGSASPLASLIRRVFNFPVPSEKSPVSVSVERTEDTDQWRRNFGGRKFASTFRQDKTGRLLGEVFGPFRFYFSLSVKEDRLNWHFQRWSLGPIPLPAALGPRIVSWEAEGQDGSYRFFSQAHFPFIGQLIYYDGFARRT